MARHRYVKIEASPEAVKAGVRIPRPLGRGMAPRTKGERFYNSDGYKPGGQFDARWVVKDPHHLRLKLEGAIVFLKEMRQRDYDKMMAAPALDGPRCAATTLAGQQCKRKPLDDSDFCALHVDDDDGKFVDDEPDKGDGDDS